MQALLAGDQETVVAQIQQVLLREGWNCPFSHVVRLELAADRLAQIQPELLVVTLSSDPARSVQALEWLENLPRQARTRVLAVGPAADSKLVLRALRGAVDDYLDQAELEAELDAALVRWRASVTVPQEAGRVIGLLAPSGGSGSSTLAANVAAALAQKHQSSLLVDLKLQAGDLAALLDLKPTHSLADLCLNVNRMDRVFFERSLVRHSSGAHLLAPPLQFTDVEHVTPEGVRRVLNMGRSLFPYVVVDLDHNFNAEQVEVLHQADPVLVVFRLDFASLRNTRRTLDQMDRLGIRRQQLRLVVNRYGQPKEIPFAKAEEALGAKIFHYVPDDPKTVNRANNNGVPVVLESPSAKIARSVMRLAESVNGQYEKP